MQVQTLPTPGDVLSSFLVVAGQPHTQVAHDTIRALPGDKPDLLEDGVREPAETAPEVDEKIVNFCTTSVPKCTSLKLRLKHLCTWHHWLMLITMVQTSMNNRRHNDPEDPRQIAQRLTLALTDQKIMQQLASAGHSARSARRAGQLRRQYAAEKAAEQAAQGSHKTGASSTGKDPNSDAMQKSDNDESASK
ncbi:hypothetical protein VTN02DRAFT_6467 [Thermoascus thermophilus]